MLGIHPGQISVIVQGPIVQGGEITTAECLKSIRRALPGAEIILSTWEREVVDGLDYDVLVQSPDPGGQPRPDGLMHNINRQIVSTLNGLQQASKIYAVKMRTNSLLENPKFLEQYDKRPLNPQYPKLFRNWVVSTELYSRNPAKTDCIRLFLPSDIFFFGLRRDLLNLWDIPLHPDQYVTSRWEDWRYCAEQWLWLSFLRKKGWRADIHRHYEFTLKGAWQSERSIVQNLIILSEAQIGLRLAQPNTGLWYPETVYRNQEWQQLYLAYQTTAGTLRRLRELEKIHRGHRIREFRGKIHLIIRHYWIRAITKIKSVLR